jgi:hypothetical protein
MVRSMIKLGLWAFIGFAAIGSLLGNTTFQTPWKYTVHSTIPSGTEVTLTQPDGEHVTMSVPEGKAFTGSNTFDVGAPVTLIAIYIMGSALGYGLKGRRRIHTGP